MGDTPWKQHERIVARYFGVERGKRGDHFGQEKSCEVVASLDAWNKASNDASSGIPIFSRGYAGVVVECKCGYSKKPMELMRDATKRCPSGLTPVLIWGPYMMAWMQDRSGERTFDKVWNDLIRPSLRLNQFFVKYYAESVHLKVPKYLDDFYRQSEEYVEMAESILKGNVIPLVALHAKGMQGRLILWRMQQVT